MNDLRDKYMTEITQHIYIRVWKVEHNQDLVFDMYTNQDIQRTIPCVVERFACLTIAVSGY